MSALPPGSARAVGRGLAGVARAPFRIRRGVVEAQLAASFPDRGPEWVRDTARECYRHFGEELAVLAGRPSAIDAALDSVLDPYPARELLAGSLVEGRGAVMVAGHLGNWELAGAYLARIGFPVTAVVQPQRGPAGRRLEGLHRRLGFDVAYRDGSPRALVRALREGRMLALVADQHARRGGARIDFLGRPAWTSLGPARLCIAARVPLFFAALVREGAGYRAVLERIDGESPGRDDDSPLALTRAWSAALAERIRERPAQYFWFHRRWKGSGGTVAEGNAPARTDVQGPKNHAFEDTP